MTNDLESIETTSHSLANMISAGSTETEAYDLINTENNFIKSSEEFIEMANSAEFSNVQSKIYNTVESVKKVMRNTAPNKIKDISLNNIQSIEASLV